MPPQLDCNRLVKEQNENREYKKHVKKVDNFEIFLNFICSILLKLKLESIRQSTSHIIDDEERIRLPEINKKVRYYCSLFSSY